jgi:hypothetical protein
MQRFTMVRYKTKPGRAAENEALSRAVFSELREKGTKHIAYAVFRDGSDFLHLFVNLKDGDADVLTGLSSFKAFSAGGGERYESAPEILRLDLGLVDAYGFATTPVPA